MRASLARLPDPIVITDASQNDWRECIVMFVNDAFVHKTHRSAESVTGLPMAALLGESTAAAATLASSVNARDAASALIPLRHSDGSLLKGRVELEPVADSVGSITHWMSVFHFDP
jgi:PAS domain-containing protein